MGRASWSHWVWLVCCGVACEWHNIDLESGLDTPDASPVAAVPAPCDGSQEYRCSGAEFQRCTSTPAGSSWLVVETCSSAETCGSIGGCLERQGCVIGQNVCVGPQLQRCGEFNFEVLAVCAGAEYCALDGCQPSVCEPGQRRCNGFQVEQCKLDHSGWEVVQRCENAERCDPDLAQCVVHPCDERSTLSCHGRLLEICSATLPAAGWIPLQDCGSPELCGVVVSNFGGSIFRNLGCISSP